MLLRGPLLGNKVAQAFVVALGRQGRAEMRRRVGKLGQGILAVGCDNEPGHVQRQGRVRRLLPKSRHCYEAFDATGRWGSCRPNRCRTTQWGLKLKGHRGSNEQLRLGAAVVILRICTEL